LRAVIAVGLGLSIACGACTSSTGDEAPEIVYDPCSPLTIAVSASATDHEVRGVAGAIAAWQARLPVQMAIGSGPRAETVLPVRFISDSGLRAVYWDAQGTISINRDLLAPAEYPIAIAHEMGHAFGLPHVGARERASVMNVGNVSLPPTGHDADEVIARWASCIDAADD
jgi:hypothetical protein